MQFVSSSDKSKAFSARRHSFRHWSLVTKKTITFPLFTASRSCRKRRSIMCFNLSRRFKGVPRVSLTPETFSFWPSRRHSHRRGDALATHFSTWSNFRRTDHIQPRVDEPRSHGRTGSFTCISEYPYDNVDYYVASYMTRAPSDEYSRKLISLHAFTFHGVITLIWGWKIDYLWNGLLRLDRYKKIGSYKDLMNVKWEYFL